MTGHLHTVDQIVEMMRARMDELVRDQWGLRDGYHDRNDWVCRSPLRHDRRPGSFRICLRGPYRGMVKDFASGETWTPLSFTAALLFKGDQSEALRWARAWLGLDGRDPASFARTRAAVERGPAEDDARAAEEREKTRGRAYARYLEARAEILDTPVDRYLRGRGLDVRRLPFPSRALRFHPALHNSETGRAWPAMVAPITGMDGSFLALHRTWLEERADGRVVKAPVADPKKAWGAHRGGAIRLWNGTRVDARTGEIRKGRKLAEAEAGTGVDLTEGIEDGLSVAIAMSELRVMAGVSIDNMAAIRWPAVVETVTLWRQNDPEGSPAAARFARLVESCTGQGKRVLIPRIPAEFKDINEFVQATMLREAG